MSVILQLFYITYRESLAPWRKIYPKIMKVGYSYKVRIFKQKDDLNKAFLNKFNVQKIYIIYITYKI